MLLKELTGYRGWKVWMSYDVHIVLLALFYVLIVDNLFRPLDSLILISSLGFYFMYGFLINDFYDMSYDVAAGKKRAVQELSKITFIGIIIAVVLMSALHLLYLKELLYTTAYIISYVLATLYSAPPIRFKNRGLSGIIVDGLIEKGLPVLAVFAFFNHFGIDTLIFVAAAFFIEVVEIVTHQMYDYKTDSRDGIHTFVVNMGIDKTLRIYNKFMAPLSGAIVIVLCSIICIKVPYATFLLVMALILYPIIHLSISKGWLNRDKIIPLYFSYIQIIINTALPLFFALILSLENPLNVTLLLVTLGSQYYVIKYMFNALKKNALMEFEIFTDN